MIIFGYHGIDLSLSGPNCFVTQCEIFLIEQCRSYKYSWMFSLLLGSGLQILNMRIYKHLHMLKHTGCEKNKKEAQRRRNTAFFRMWKSVNKLLGEKKLLFVMFSRAICLFVRFLYFSCEISEKLIIIFAFRSDIMNSAWSTQTHRHSQYEVVPYRWS